MKYKSAVLQEQLQVIYIHEPRRKPQKSAAQNFAGTSHMSLTDKTRRKHQKSTAQNVSSGHSFGNYSLA